MFFETKGTWLALFAKESLAADANIPFLGSGSPGLTLAYNVRFNEEVDSLISRAVSFRAMLLKPPQGTECAGYSGYFAPGRVSLRGSLKSNPSLWIESSPVVRNLASSETPHHHRSGVVPNPASPFSGLPIPCICLRSSTPAFSGVTKGNAFVNKP